MAYVIPARLSTILLWRKVRHYLDVIFVDRWIGRGDPIAKQPQLPNISCLDFFFVGTAEEYHHCNSPSIGRGTLRQTFFAAVAEVRDMPGVFHSVRQSFLRRCSACFTIGVHCFEQLF